MPKTPVEIAVIGAGPKAAALAAKAEVLNRLRLANINITIFEAERIGAHWDGRSGYTDGLQPLCTPAERDVGFPYRSILSHRVDELLFSDYSWPAYKMRDETYSDWVDRGRNPPSHGDFVRYITWVIEEANLQPVYKKVVQLAPTDDRKWSVRYDEGAGVTKFHEIHFDAVVITGPGAARHVSKDSVDNIRVFDGTTFWTHRNQIKNLLQERTLNPAHTAASTESPTADPDGSEPPQTVDPIEGEPDKFDDKEVAIIGGGGTSAAIVSWLVRSGFHDYRINVIANQPLYSRVESQFENRYFRDESAWKELSPELRLSFCERLNRGVVWSSVLNDLRSATGLQIMHGQADRIEITDKGRPILHLTRWDNERPSISPSIVIDASGFDPWWFRDLLKGSPRDGHWDDKDRKSLLSTVEESLRFGPSQWDLPPLHVPNLAQLEGPGLGSLMSLGAMSDRILAAYAHRRRPRKKAAT